MTPFILLSFIGLSLLMPVIAGGDGDDSDDIAAQPDESDETPAVQTPAPDAPEHLNGTTANDTLATRQTQTVNGYSGSDTLTAADGADGATLNGGRDADTLNIVANDVTANGARGNDTFNITGSGIQANGNSGDDTYTVGDPASGDQAGDNSTLSGGTGNDTITALNNPSFLEVNGGDGNDIIMANGSGIALNGEAGADTIIYSGDTESYAFGGSGDDLLTASDLGQGLAGRMSGGAGEDTLTVDPDNLTLDGPLALNGDEGDDVLQNITGREGISLSGGEGNDRLDVVFDVNANGGGGTLHGGAAADRFFVEMEIGETTAEVITESVTRITDFTRGEDILNLIIDAPQGAAYTYSDITIVEEPTGLPLGAVTEVRVTFDAAAADAPAITSSIFLEGISELTLDDFVVTTR